MKRKKKREVKVLSEETLYERLSGYASGETCPMHMPGHKRNTALLGSDLPFGIDITEIDGFDNLHDPSGVLKETADIAASLYGSEKAFPLVNGSTAGILAGVSGATRRGDSVILARNCHMSVYNAVALKGLRAAYILPDTDTVSGVNASITPEQVRTALEVNADAKLVILTSPTYEGVISDIRAITEAAHEKGVPVLVDEAHGAHLGFSSYFPGEAIAGGADIVVTGLHKTLPALTQCALLHVSGSLINSRRIADALDVFETSSPSYVLMSSIDFCVRLLSKKKGALFAAYEENLHAFDAAVKDLGKLRVLCHGSDTLPEHGQFFLFDPGKLVICTRGTDIAGPALMEYLREKEHIELEMAYTDYAIAMTSICDEPENFVRLARALTKVDKRAADASPGGNQVKIALPEVVMPVSRALEMDGGNFIALEKAIGAVSLEYVWAYPPGTPFLVPGERIGGGTVELVNELVSAGVTPRSTRGKMPGWVFALK